MHVSVLLRSELQGSPLHDDGLCVAVWSTRWMWLMFMGISQRGFSSLALML